MQLIIQAGDLGPKWFHVALRTLVLLTSSESMLKSHYIAERLGEDPTFVRKILSKLAYADYVKSHGGDIGVCVVKIEYSDTLFSTYFHFFSLTFGYYYIILIITSFRKNLREGEWFIVSFFICFMYVNYFVDVYQ
ncbi:hypothetical protein BHU24_18460 [Bacillus pseudomycoides]|uniref:Rrf2 family transcriptional regulator n=1 Tax=Bacillus pseudomycoides TaxID=64104 RepID=UPI000BEE5983|nr:Rrf2 family transcriptional regulator [Bacillus pseudomycoides]MBD5800209.1 hypothetical protein [Bacillus pseudomycoides]MED1474373.1 Rrf2 family transcriptional regulator [Bacillus pseudomycoides]MED4653707.1 Rrf2 family transcriptional regulator [Bacillus pseudomycoides]PEE03102.1 hypothetical protein CON86_27295 [Bacillus pseudomycoides]PEM35512.1 hypothetical protein CN634_24535 [Bacillus pseudomycoides]